MARTSSLAVASWLVLAAFSGGGEAAAEEPVDRRSHEQVRLDCSSGEHSRAVSLFANGTVRIRDRGGPEPGMRLAELVPDELVAFQNRMSEIDLSEVRSRIQGPSGETLEQCLLRLELVAGEVKKYRFLRMAALPLALSRLIVVIEDITALAEQRERTTSGLPADYEARVGDILVKRDGSRHRVVRVTADGGGLEIIALDSPLLLYLTKDTVRGEFQAIESRRRPVVRPNP